MFWHRKLTYSVASAVHTADVASLASPVRLLSASIGLIAAGAVALGVAFSAHASDAQRLLLIDQAADALYQYSAPSKAVLGPLLNTGADQPSAAVTGLDGQLYVGLVSAHAINRYDVQTGAL